MMKLTLLVFVALFAVAFCAPDIAGTWRQCNINDGAETILDIDEDNNVEMTFYYGGCLGTNLYEISASFSIDFEEERDDGGWNVRLNFDNADAIPHTADAAAALENTCGGSFREERSKSVLDCLFCDRKYDIFTETDEGFVFGITKPGACSKDDRPDEYEESQYLKYEGADGGNSSDAHTLAAGLATLFIAVALLI